MKKIFTLLTSSALSLSLLANDADLASSLTIKSNSESSIKVVVDGKDFISGYNSIKISNVDAGMHIVTVYQKSSSDVTYCDDAYQMTYNASLAVEPASQISITIGRSGKAKVSQQAIAVSQSYSYSDNADLSDKYGNSSVIANTDFSFVIQSIQKEWVESNRMKSATQIINTNFFTTEQVKQLLQLFTSDDNQLELAKKAYDRTIDQDNYKCVSDVLSFRNKIELEKYIQGCK